LIDFVSGVEIVRLVLLPLCAREPAFHSGLDVLWSLHILHAWTFLPHSKGVQVRWIAHVKSVRGCRDGTQGWVGLGYDALSESPCRLSGPNGLPSALSGFRVFTLRDAEAAVNRKEFPLSMGHSLLSQ